MLTAVRKSKQTAAERLKEFNLVMCANLMRVIVRGPLLCVLSTILALLITGNKSRADELTFAPEGTCSIVVIPDTQHY